MAFAADNPTRMPVNNPGPTSTATTLISASSMPACLQTKSIAGTNVSA